VGLIVLNARLSIMRCASGAGRRFAPGAPCRCARHGAARQRQLPGVARGRALGRAALDLSATT
jgi:hypothetical protein